MKPSLSALPIRALAAALFAGLQLLSFAQAAEPPASSEPVQLRNQAPGFFRMQLGDFTVTTLFDKSLQLPTSVLQGAAPGQIQTLLDAGGNPLSAFPVSDNAFLIHTGRELVLIDTGAGRFYGEGDGSLLDNLRAAGYQPEQVGKIILTHLHADHIGGLLRPDGQPAFPNAAIYSHSADFALWTSAEMARSTDPAKRKLHGIVKTVSATYRAAGRWHTFDGQAEIAPGVTAVPLPGHTAGHTGVKVSSHGETLWTVGDMIHNLAAQSAQPEIYASFDTDGGQAAATRRQAFARIAAGHDWIAAAHAPFPGIGRLRDDGGRFAWLPAERLPLAESPR